MVAKGKKAKKQDSKRDRLTRRQRKAIETSYRGGDDLDSQLRSLGLCTKNITGDGNCLFRSLSDQYHGQDSNYQVVRQEICQYLKENKETYQFFVEDDQSFDHHIECMEQNATFGGNMELVAFAKLKAVDIKVYQPGMIYVIHGVDEENTESELDEEDRQTLHIAYHSWEHYSSVRNMNGPFTGPPEIKTVEQNPKDVQVDQEEKEEDVELDSKEKVVRNACPEANIRTIRRLLRKHKGDPNKVIDVIFASTAENEEAEKVMNEATNDISMKHGQDTVTSAPEETTTEPLIAEEQVDTTSLAPKEEESTSKPKKKLSAAERKKEAKKRQKENKMLKDRAKAARKAKREEPTTTAATQSMKEMLI